MSMTPTQQAVADEIQRFHRVKAQHGASEVIVVAAEEIVALKAKTDTQDEALRRAEAFRNEPVVIAAPELLRALKRLMTAAGEGDRRGRALDLIDGIAWRAAEAAVRLAEEGAPL